MAMRVSGINSGLDTDAIVQELVSAYSKKTEKYEKEQTKLSWKQEAWKSLNSKVYSFYTNTSKLKYSSAYAAKKVSVSDTTKASVTASGNAVNGTQKLNVLQTAQSAYLTGGKISTTNGEAATSETKLSELGFTENATIQVNTTDSEGKAIKTDIKLTKDSTLADVTKELQNAGVNASFDEKNGRLYISSKNSGTAGDFTITASDAKGTNANTANRLLDTLGIGSNSYAAGNAITTKQGKTAVMSTTLANLGYTGDETTFTVNGKDITVDSKTTISDLLDKFKEAGISANFDGATGKLSFNSSEELNFTGNADVLNLLGLDSGLKADTSRNPIKLDGSDAMIVLNGVLYTSDSNSFSVNGLNITANSVTDDINTLLDSNGEVDLSKLTDANAISITTSTDTQGIYDTIKDFLTEYNNIINEMTKLYNADSARDYEPLTDDEKDAMSDTEIEKWETKIKDSLLRRDSSLDSIMSSMISAMNKGIVINGETYALSSFGIHTMGYLNAAENEQNAFHIDGDEDDENTSGNKDKLMTAITEDADTVIEFMKQLSSNLYKAIDDNMQSTTMRSRYKIYNDKELDKQYSNYSKLISQWEEKVSDKEEYYYKQFTAMESALAKLNSQQSSLAGLLGGS
ncbi:MAG: flagellar filament capping protein FliD [Lachnospiraceae bacterium]|nr:flagellar filament capping protein FliD [Lachnospiraceae bacterium]MDY5521458.1 flagellar filament capping protein FliD [Agathobacter sp.]